MAIRAKRGGACLENNEISHDASVVTVLGESVMNDMTDTAEGSEISRDGCDSPPRASARHDGATFGMISTVRSNSPDVQEGPSLPAVAMSSGHPVRCGILVRVRACALRAYWCC